MTDSGATHYERLGGRVGVAKIVAAFVDRVFADLIIGFFFEGRDKARIVARETELAIQHLGGAAVYRGRPLGQVHQLLKINRGQFRRRLAILKLVLEAHDVPQDIAQAWIARDASLEPIIATEQDCLD